MNDKGFAITGIIYTLFILFLMILLTVLTGLNSYRRLMVNSTKSLEDDFEGFEIKNDLNVDNDEFDQIENNGVAKVLGKYIFKLNFDDNNILECSAYLNNGTAFKNEDKEYYTANEFSEKIAKLSPQLCNTLEYKMELIRVYSFEGDNLYEKN